MIYSISASCSTLKFVYDVGYKGGQMSHTNFSSVNLAAKPNGGINFQLHDVRDLKICRYFLSEAIFKKILIFNQMM